MKALITGVTGQDGWYLTNLLISKGYEVHGLVRRTSTRNADVLTRLHKVVSGSVENYTSIASIIQLEQYDEIYHLAAQSFVTESFIDPATTIDINVNGTLNILEAIRHFSKHTKLYFAATSEMFGNEKGPQSEHTPFSPRSPYGASKLSAYHLVKVYREAYDLFACSGILFNHESPKRGKEFVTQKIVQNVVRGCKYSLGNLGARRDWGHAKDYVEAMYRMLQYVEPTDFVIGTGVTRSIDDFIYAVEQIVGYKSDHHIDPELYRPAEVNELVADYSKARKLLHWQPTVPFYQLVRDMVFAEEQRINHG